MHLWDRFMGTAQPIEVRDEEQIIPDVKANEDKLQRDLNMMDAQAAFDPYGYGLDGQPLGLPTWATWCLIAAIAVICLVVAYH